MYVPLPTLANVYAPVESEVVVRVIGAVDPVGVPVKVTVTPAMPDSVDWPVPSLLLST